MNKWIPQGDKKIVAPGTTRVSSVDDIYQIITSGRRPSLKLQWIQNNYNVIKLFPQKEQIESNKKFCWEIIKILDILRKNIY